MQVVRLVKFTLRGPEDWIEATLKGSLADEVHHLGPGRSLSVVTMAGPEGGERRWWRRQWLEGSL